MKCRKDLCCVLSPPKVKNLRNATVSRWKIKAARLGLRARGLAVKAANQVKAQTRCFIFPARNKGGSRPLIGSGIEKIDSPHFLAGCRKRRLNEALSVLSLSLDFFECVCCAVI